MFDRDLADLDADAVLSEVVNARAVADRAEVRILQAAAHWADLHGHLNDPSPGCSLPGAEQLVRLGGVGTPKVAEFAPAELASVLATSAHAGASLIGDVLDLRHRLPHLWARVQAGQVKPWLARRVAQGTRAACREVAAAVDIRVAPYAHSLSPGRLDKLVAAALIAADPEGAGEDTMDAAQTKGVWVGQGNHHGIKTIVARTDVPDAIRLDAVVDRIADALGLLGDADSKDIRRAKAIGYLTRPHDTLDLFDSVAALNDPDGCPSPRPTDPAPSLGDTAGLQRGDGASAGVTRDRRRKPPAVVLGPTAVLYVHLTDQALRGCAGVGRIEGEGPVTTDQVRSWLGHSNVVVKPVLDLGNQTPIDGYEVPDRLRDAIHLRSPIDAFPFATSTGRTKQADHTEPYRSIDDGGPPGQTRTDNLAGLTTLHHRIKTQGRWKVRQPYDGVLVWRSPHGRHYLVDHTGTTPAFTASLPASPDR